MSLKLYLYILCVSLCVLQTDGWGKDTKALTGLDWFDNLVICFFKANDKHQQLALPAVTVIGLNTRFPRVEMWALANQRQSIEVNCGDVPSAIKKPDRTRPSHFTLSYQVLPAYLSPGLLAPFDFHICHILVRVLGVRRVVVKCATLSISLTITESQGTERKDSLTSLKIRFIDTHTLMVNNIVLYWKNLVCIKVCSR